jgi:hypothetical protein
MMSEGKKKSEVGSPKSEVKPKAENRKRKAVSRSEENPKSNPALRDEIRNKRTANC